MFAPPCGNSDQLSATLCLCWRPASRAGGGSGVGGRLLAAGGAGPPPASPPTPQIAVRTQPHTLTHTDTHTDLQWRLKKVIFRVIYSLFAFFFCRLFRWSLPVLKLHPLPQHLLRLLPASNTPPCARTHAHHCDLFNKQVKYKLDFALSLYTLCVCVYVCTRACRGGRAVVELIAKLSLCDSAVSLDNKKTGGLHLCVSVRVCVCMLVCVCVCRSSSSSSPAAAVWPL